MRTGTPMLPSVPRGGPVATPRVTSTSPNTGRRASSYRGTIPRMSLVRALALVTSGSLAACSVLVSTAGLMGDAGTDVSSPFEAGPDAGSDDVAVDAGSNDAAVDVGSNDASIVCGMSTCTSGLVCCMTSPASLVCATSCPANDLTIRCDDRTDCASGEVCCAVGWSQGPPGNVSCVTAAACEGVADSPRCIAGKPQTCGGSSTCRSDVTSTGYAFESCQ